MRSGPAAVWPEVRPSLRVLYLVALVLVVLVVAFLQSRWISQVSDAQEIRVKSHLREETGLISDALDTEIMRAALAFSIPPAPGSSAYEVLERTWATWNHDAPWPGIVSGLSFVESRNSEGGDWLTRSLGDPGALEVRSILPSNVSGDSLPFAPHGGSPLHPGARIPDLFVVGQPYLLRPIPNFSFRPAGPQINWVLIHYDLTYLADAAFPRLLEKYSTAGDRIDFQFQIVPKGAKTPGAVAVADLFHYRPTCLTQYTLARPEVSPNRLTPDTHGAIFQFGQVRSRLGGGDRFVSLNSILHAAGQCLTPPSPSGTGLMQLSVSRAPGAVSDAYIRFRWRNQFLSGLVLVVLLAALAMLVVSTERARKLARMQTFVAAWISHELRTPLASLRVAADDLKSGHVANVEQARRYGEIIDLQSRRLGHVVDQSIALTTPAQSNGSPCLRSVFVPEILSAAVNALAPLLCETKIQVERRIAPNVPGILADPDLALRCLTNLIENAIKYAASGGWILLSARECRHSGRSMVEVTIEDRGPGIEREEVTAVFEPFYRGKSARRSREPGSGLGLAIVRHTMETYGGSIKLERVLPNGCRFRLFFLTENRAIVHPADSEVAG